MGRPLLDGSLADTLFDVLSDRRRRFLCRHLVADGGVHTVDELADRVFVMEREAGADPTPDRAQIATSLYHHQLPKLASAGLIEYDPVGRTVRYRETEFARVLPELLDLAAVPEVEDPSNTRR